MNASGGARKSLTNGLGKTLKKREVKGTRVICWNYCS
jgi:hypothetical protein